MTVEEAVTEGDAVASRVTLRDTHEGEFVGIEPTDESFEEGNTVLALTDDGNIVERWFGPDTLECSRSGSCRRLECRRRRERSRNADVLVPLVQVVKRHEEPDDRRHDELEEAQSTVHERIGSPVEVGPSNPARIHVQRDRQPDKDDEREDPEPEEEQGDQQEDERNRGADDRSTAGAGNEDGREKRDTGEHDERDEQQARRDVRGDPVPPSGIHGVQRRVFPV